MHLVNQHIFYLLCVLFTNMNNISFYYHNQVLGFWFPNVKPTSMLEFSNGHWLCEQSSVGPTV